MVRGFRWAFAGLAWAFVAGVVYQVLLIGLHLFSEESTKAHIDFGYLLSLAPVLVVVAGAVGRVGRSLLIWSAGLLVLTFVQTLLPPLRDAVPLASALHPVGAMLIFWTAVTIAGRATELARQTTA